MSDFVDFPATLTCHQVEAFGSSNHPCYINIRMLLVTLSKSADELKKLWKENPELMLEMLEAVPETLQNLQGMTEMIQVAGNRLANTAPVLEN